MGVLHCELYSNLPKVNQKILKNTQDEAMIFYGQVGYKKSNKKGLLGSLWI